MKEAEREMAHSVVVEMRIHFVCIFFLFLSSLPLLFFKKQQ